MRKITYTQQVVVEVELEFILNNKYEFEDGGSAEYVDSLVSMDLIGIDPLELLILLEEMKNERA